MPPVPSERPAPLPGGASLAVALPVETAAPLDDWRATLGHDTLDGAALYQAACAACHGIAGGGSERLVHPSLRLVTGNAAHAENLVQVIAHGVEREVDGAHVLMPGFRDALSDAQIAALAAHVRTSFGGVEGEIDAARVSAVLSGDVGTPWLIANARWLAALGIAAGLALLALLAWLLLRSGRRDGRSA